MPPYHTIKRLVIIAPNWLGDAVMAQPAIADLGRALPGATIAVAARPSMALFFRMLPEIRETLAVADLTPPTFDAALVLPNSFRSALLVLRAGIPERWGYRTDWRGRLLTRAVSPVSGVHQVEYYRHLVGALGFPAGPLEAPRIVVPDGVRRAGAEQLRSAGWDGRARLVAIAPGAAFGSAKRWPPASFAELARRFLADGVHPVFVGGAADRPIGQEIIREIGAVTGMFDLIGQNDVAGMAGVFAHCRTLVSNDSGAMHLGVAVGLPVTAPFGPTDERLTRPLGNQHTVLTHPVWCRPCMLRVCPLDHRCIRGIPVEAVADAARRAL